MRSYAMLRYARSQAHTKPPLFSFSVFQLSDLFLTEKPTARLSPQLPRRRESKRHLFVVDSLDKHMQNEKELIRLRRFMPAARTTRARSAQFRLRRELPCTRVVQILPAAQTTRTRH